MAWFKVDDSFYDHQKVESIDDNSPHLRSQSLALWLISGCWSSKHLTDGVISRRKVVRMGFTHEAAEALVACGLWEMVSDDPESDYQFHDWEDWNPTRSEVEMKRALDNYRKHGTRSEVKRARVLKEWGGCCAYCGDGLDGRTLTVDHITPITRGGSNHVGNLAAACRQCNVSKGDMTPEEWIDAGIDRAHDAMASHPGSKIWTIVSATTGRSRRNGPDRRHRRGQKRPERQDEVVRIDPLTPTRPDPTRPVPDQSQTRATGTAHAHDGRELSPSDLRQIEGDRAMRDGTPGGAWMTVMRDCASMTPPGVTAMRVGTKPPPGLVDRLEDSSVEDVVRTCREFYELCRTTPDAKLVPGDKRDGGGTVLEFWGPGRLWKSGVWESVKALLVRQGGEAAADVVAEPSEASTRFLRAAAKRAGGAS